MEGMNREAELKKIEGWLEDEESRFIFEKRIAFGRTRDYQYIKEIVDRTVNRDGKHETWFPEKKRIFAEQVIQKCVGGRQLVAFGAGQYGENFKVLCEEYQLKIAFFTDNDEKKWNTELDGCKIVAPDTLKEGLGEHSCIVICVKGNERINQIRTQCMTYGVNPEDILIFADAVFYVEKQQYFDRQIIRLQNHESFVDAGCFNFNSSLNFIEAMNAENYSFDKIWCFEPDAKNYVRCRNNIDRLERRQDVTLVQAGLWDKDTRVGFESSGGGDSKIVEGKNDSSCAVVALDSVIKGRVTFIKMDIEGAELKALMGAKELIRKYRPKLAICIYHKAEDMWEIPTYIKELIPAYKLYIRHYSNYECETVLYAVAEGDKQ